MQSHIKKKKNQVENEEFPSPILNSRNISSMKNIYATSSRYMYFSLKNFSRVNFTHPLSQAAESPPESFSPPGAGREENKKA